MVDESWMMDCLLEGKCHSRFRGSGRNVNGNKDFLLFEQT